MRWITHLILMIGFALILFDSVSMSVYDRMREIGVIRAIGSPGGLVFWMVIFESAVLSLMGAGLGILMGGSIVTYYYFAGPNLGVFAKGLSIVGLGSVLYPYLTAADLAETLLVTLAVALLAALYPAWRAVRITPVEAIYHR